MHYVIVGGGSAGWMTALLGINEIDRAVSARGSGLRNRIGMIRRGIHVGA